MLQADVHRGDAQRLPLQSVRTKNATGDEGALADAELYPLFQPNQGQFNIEGRLFLSAMPMSFFLSLNDWSASIN